MKQHVGKVVVGEFKMSLVVELEQGRTVWVVLLQVDVVHLGLVSRVPAFFANVNLFKFSKQISSKMTRHNSKIANLYLCSSFFVLVLMGDAVHLEAVGFERTPLREGFLAQGALVRPDTCFLTNTD